jgi:hypothetical protein
MDYRGAYRILDTGKLQVGQYNTEGKLLVVRIEWGAGQRCKTSITGGDSIFGNHVETEIRVSRGAFYVEKRCIGSRKKKALRLCFWMALFTTVSAPVLG